MPKPLSQPRRNHGRVLRILAFAAALAAPRAHAETLGYVTPRTSAEIAASPWGIQCDAADRPAIFARAGQLGAKWTRIVVGWPAVERERDHYRFDSADKAIDAARAEAIEPFVCLTDGNRLYSAAIPNPDPNWRLIYGAKPAPPILDPAATAAWLRFVDAIVAHAKDRVNRWEIWNEPNHYAYWGAPPDARAYGRLVRVTAARIRALQPGAVIIAGAVAGLDPKFIAGFLTEDTDHAVAIVSFHNYAALPEARMYSADDTWSALRAHDPRLQLWQGECGYPSASSTRDFRGLSPWGPTVQAKWLLRQAFVDTFFMRCAVSNYFRLYDGGDRDELQPRPTPRPVDRILGFPSDPDGRRVRGRGVNEKCLLSNPGLEPKPAYYAYQNLCAVFDARYRPAEIDGRAAVTVTSEGQFAGIGRHDDAYPSVPLVAGFRAQSGAALLAYWLPWQPQEYTPRPARITLRAPGFAFREPVLVDLLDGSVHSLPAPRVAAGETIFTDLPLFDFPLVIIERSSLTIRTEASAPVSDAVPEF